ncbi:hypothetical protein [Leucobacter musarum]|uniref:hypothetical protein n=1 Tax=Leucobacter musarum TaxID=1930747 RepID=UPI0006A7693F|nr:hypothetical protein [Leucobacter musarum]
MQLGARWQTGATPHRGVPPLLHAAIAHQESAHPNADSWTLTWLEGRPRCVLDDLAFVGLDARGRVLSGALPGASPADRAGAPDPVSGSSLSVAGHGEHLDDDEDDWLS